MYISLSGASGQHNACMSWWLDGVGCAGIRRQREMLISGMPCGAEIHAQTVVIGNANVLPGIDLRDATGCPDLFCWFLLGGVGY